MDCKGTVGSSLSRFALPRSPPRSCPDSSLETCPCPASKPPSQLLERRNSKRLSGSRPLRGENERCSGSRVVPQRLSVITVCLTVLFQHLGRLHDLLGPRPYAQIFR